MKPSAEAPKNFCINRVLDPRTERRGEDRGETQEETGEFCGCREVFNVKGWIRRVFGRRWVFFEFVSRIVGSNRLRASNTIKKILVKISCPRALIKRIIKSFLDKTFAPGPTATQEAKMALWFCMPYLGRHSLHKLKYIENFSNAIQAFSYPCYSLVS